MLSRRFRELAGLSRLSINEDMAQATKQNGRWSDGVYGDGDAVTIHGHPMSLEFEPDMASHSRSSTGDLVEGAWFAIGESGEEIGFVPGSEDRHDPIAHNEQAYPAIEELEEEPIIENSQTVTEVKRTLDRFRDMAERIATIARVNGPLARKIDEIGGDSSCLNDLATVAGELFSQVDECDYAARSHLSSEADGEINEISSDMATRYTKRAKMDREFNDDELDRLPRKQRYGSDDDSRAAGDRMKTVQRRNNKRQRGLNRASKRM
jgi:hypothetical protein